MEEAQYHLLARIEAWHWWHRALHETVERALARHDAASGMRILDVGCGTGGLALRLGRRHRVHAMDISPLAMGYCRRNGLVLLAQASVGALPFRDQSFDVVTAMDVLYHHDAGCELAGLGECRRVLRPGGLLVLNLPAFRWLRGRHDDAVATARRYTRTGVLRLLREAGFAVQRAHYRLAFLPPLMLLRRLLETVDGDGRRPELEMPATWLNGLLAAAARLEAGMGHPLPLGSSVFCIAVRPGGSPFDPRAGRVQASNQPA